MSRRRLLALGSVLLLSGCLYHATEHTDQAVCALTAHPFDPAPGADAPGSAAARTPSKAPDKDASAAPAPSTDLRTAALIEAADETQAKIERPPVKIPSDVPAADTPRVPNFNKLPKAEQLAAIRKLYPPLPPLEDEPAALPGPGGMPYTLAELQQTAAGNSPTLRQAASDVEAAKAPLRRPRPTRTPRSATRRLRPATAARRPHRDSGSTRRSRPSASSSSRRRPRKRPWRTPSSP